MNLECLKLLQDILDSIALVESHISDISTLADYKKDLKTIDAVERRIAIIGEALWKVDKLQPTLQVSDKKKIISLRHILVHDYDLIQDETIWIICQKYLPVLKSEIQTITNT